MIDIVAKVNDYKQSKLKIWPCHSNRASALGDECERKLVLMRTSWDKALLKEVEFVYVCDEGNNQEQAVLNDLRSAGLTITEQQRPFSWPEHQISGMIDAKVKDEVSSVPLEIKSMSPMIWEQINSIEDLAKYPWTAKYKAQMLLYLLMGNSEEGILLLKNKSTGKLKQLIIKLNEHLDYAEQLLQKADRINKHIADKTLPEKINNFKLCSDCEFKHICLPECLNEGGIEFIDNEALEKSLDHREILSAGAKEYSAIDKEVKEELKRYMVNKQIINCGKWVIEKNTNAKGSVSFDFSKLKG